MAKVLIGFMGSGKSTVARLLDDNYIDMDSLITEKIGMPIADYFDIEGEESFRRLESQVLEELLKMDSVISTGGGVIVNPYNRSLLSKNKDTIYLKADFDTLYSRISKDKLNKRPLFITNSRDQLRQIFEQRQVWYEEVSTQQIDVTMKTPEEIIEEIL